LNNDDDVLPRHLTFPQVSIRGHEVRSARLANGQPVDVEAGETLEFEGVGEDYIRWTGGRLGPGFVKIGLSLRNVGLAAKPGEQQHGSLVFPS
jgi:hypothetical protein